MGPGAVEEGGDRKQEDGGDGEEEVVGGERGVTWRYGSVEVAASVVVARGSMPLRHGRHLHCGGARLGAMEEGGDGEEEMGTWWRSVVM